MVCLSSPLFPVTASVLLSDMASTAPPPHCKEHHKCCRRTPIQLILYQVHLNPPTSPNLQSVFQGAIRIPSFGFRRCLNSEQSIHHPQHHAVQTLERSMTRMCCVLKDCKRYSHCSRRVIQRHLRSRH